MSLYTPVFPPSLECRSTGRNGTPSSNKLDQPSSAEILRDIHLFLATKPEVLAPPSRPSSPSFDTNVERLKRSIFDAIEAARGDTGNGKWRQVSEKLKMGCVRGKYRMTGLNQGWHPAEDAQWILPDDEETWFKLEEERAEVRRLKENAKRSRHPDDAPIAAVTPPLKPDMADNALPVEIVDVRETISPKTMRNVKEKVAKWRATIATFEGAPGASKTVIASVQRDSSESSMKGKPSAKNKSQSSSLGFPVVKRNVATAAGKKGEGRSDGNPLPDHPANGVQGDNHAPNGSKSLPAKERQVAPCNGEPEKASFKAPLMSVLAPDGELPKITDFPETVRAKVEGFFLSNSSTSTFTLH
jgi:Wiskott-Aldrich syndrome protein